jgi:4-amino-4-deoxy-L-arabinose transferase-like glycosyltransferase
LVLAGLVLRLLPLLRDPFHQDEVLYAFWGRLISSGRDLWLTSVPVDKPPLVPYLIAASQAVFGGSEFSVRLAGLAASLLSIPLTYSLAFRLYASRTAGLVAAAVMALTPYAVLFGATAFTDPILVAWWLTGCWAALSGRWGWAGLMLGLAIATKQQAIALAPLVLGLGLVGWQWQPVRLWSATRSTGGRSSNWVKVGRFLLGVIGVLAVVVAWDKLRLTQGATVGFWGQSVDSYGGLRVIWPSELQSRLRGWAQLGGYLFGWSWLGALFLAGTSLVIGSDLTRGRQTRAALADLVLVTFACLFLFFHWLVAFPVWDRYLLPIVPVAALLLGRMVILFRERWQAERGRWYRRSHRFVLMLCVLLLLSLVVGGMMAADGRIPVGGDHGAYDGLKDVTAFLRTLPVGTVVYDRWLSWHYDYYLFDAYLYRAGFPTPEWLAADAAAFFDGRPRYVVIPDWESSVRMGRALAEVDLVMSPVLTTMRRDGESSFTVYEIAPGDRD